MMIIERCRDLNTATTMLSTYVITNAVKQSMPVAAYPPGLLRATCPPPFGPQYVHSKSLRVILCHDAEKADASQRQHNALVVGKHKEPSLRTQ